MRNSRDEFITCQKLQFSLFMFFQGRMLGVGVGPWEIWDENGKYDLKAWTLRFVAKLTPSFMLMTVVD